MLCYNIARDFLQERKGKTIKVLVEGGGFRPITGKLIDFDDAVMVLETEGGLQWMLDMANVTGVADESGGAAVIDATP
ncbi:MAG: hypothetical protein ACE14P_05715 [Methanotrichaceae archaeon]